jgi:hypothetical protein
MDMNRIMVKDFSVKQNLSSAIILTSVMSKKSHLYEDLRCTSFSSEPHAFLSGSLQQKLLGRFLTLACIHPKQALKSGKVTQWIPHRVDF